MPSTTPQNQPAVNPLVIGLTQNPTPAVRCQTQGHPQTPSGLPATNQSGQPSPSPMGNQANGSNGSQNGQPTHPQTPSHQPTQPTEPSAQTAPNSTMPNPTQNPMMPNPPTQPQPPATPNLKALALETLIGPRGTVKVSSGKGGNKNLVKRWLSEKGVAFSVSGYARIDELAMAYNDLSDKTLNDMINQSKTGSQPQQNQQTQQSTTANQQQGQQTPSAQQNQQTEPSQTSSEPTQTAVPMIPKVEPTVPKKRKGHSGLHALHGKIVESMSVGLNAFVFGPAGSGKTTLAGSVAKTLGLRLFMTGAVRKDFKLFGFIDAHGKYRSTVFRDAFENGGLFLFDEIDASDSGVLLQLNAALANGVCDFPDATIMAHPDFRVMASANTNGDGATAAYAARVVLDGATKDRFIVETCDYDEELIEHIVTTMCSNPEDLAVCLDWNKDVTAIRKLAKKMDIQMILSPRATFMGVKLLTNPNRQHFKTKADLMDSLVWNKLSDTNTRNRLKTAFIESQTK